MRRRVHLLALATLAAAGACERGAPVPVDPAALAGTGSCLACHQDKSGFLATAHHLSSAPASEASVHGEFAGDAAILRTSNPYLHYRMEARGEGLFQTAASGEAGAEETRTERIDLVIGSGRKGQTYLSWRDSTRLYQLPVSYWTELGRWVNSPGYPDGLANFDRPATPRCLECHTSLFRSTGGSEAGGNSYDRESVAVGISCERCHGPGAKHVARQRSPLLRHLGAAIVNPADLPRIRQIEVCAQCHGGIGESVAPAFSYVPGQPLERHLRMLPPDPGEEIDVHGNQVALLARSPCFQGSDMTCSTCHDPHVVQRDPADFSAKCASCHQPQQCGLFPEQGDAIVGRCTECHMPELRSNTIISSFEGRSVQPSVRTHLIRSYR